MNAAEIDMYAALEARVARLEQCISQRFIDQITPEMTCRDVILLWLSQHKFLSSSQLTHEAEMQNYGFSRTGFRNALLRMHQAGLLQKVAFGVYTLPGTT